MQFKDIFNYEEIIHTSVKKKGFRSISQYYGGYSQPVFCQYDKPFSKKKWLLQLKIKEQKLI